MRISIFKNPSTIEISVEFSQIANAIKLGHFQDRLFSPAGIMSVSGNKKNSLIYTGLVLLTFDANSAEEMNRILQRVNEMSTTYCSFRNPLRTGLNVLVKTDSLEGHHKTAYQQVVETYQNYLGIEVSNNQPDEKILCQLSHDPEIYYKFNSKVVQVSFNTTKTIITEEQLNETYKEVYDEAVKYTGRIVSFNGETKDGFIYTLAVNCLKEGLPQVKALEFVMSDYGDDNVIKGIVKRAYRSVRNNRNDDKELAFSINLMNFMNYKKEVECDKRVLFEALIIKFISFRGEFYFPDSLYQKELGIKRTRRTTIINEFIQLGFLHTENRRQDINHKQVTVTYYDINPEHLTYVAEELMNDSSEFVSRILPIIYRYKSTSSGYFPS